MSRLKVAPCRLYVGTHLERHMETISVILLADLLQIIQWIDTTDELFDRNINLPNRYTFMKAPPVTFIVIFEQIRPRGGNLENLENLQFIGHLVPVQTLDSRVMTRTISEWPNYKRLFISYSFVFFICLWTSDFESGG